VSETERRSNGAVAPVIDLRSALEAIRATRQRITTLRSVLVGVTGIDGAGKGYLTARIVKGLRRGGLHAVGINADGWLNLPHVRFGENRRAEHFYRHAIRFEALFEQLILPLKRRRSHAVLADFAEETAREFRKHEYAFFDVDVIVLEGIYLLKPPHRDYFDLVFWVDCSFETALERALARAQEGLSATETARAYETIYFPAQRVHLQRDHPREAAHFIIVNDRRLLAAARVPRKALGT
jgi:uridine kinase